MDVPNISKYGNYTANMYVDTEGFPANSASNQLVLPQGPAEVLTGGVTTRSEINA